MYFERNLRARGEELAALRYPPRRVYRQRRCFREGDGGCEALFCVCRHDCEMERVVAVPGLFFCHDLIPQHIRHRVGHAIGVCITVSTPVSRYYPGFVPRHRVNQYLH